jgi:hypothetical protein
MTFLDVVLVAGGNREFVDALDKLVGTSFGAVFRASGIDAAIDQTTGLAADTAALFACYVYDLIWLRMPRTVRADGTEVLATA